MFKPIDFLKNRSLMFSFKILGKFIKIYEPELFTGEQASLTLAEKISQAEYKKLLIMTTSGIKRRGQLDSVIEQLKNDGVSVFVFDDINPDPTFADVSKALEHGLSNQFDAVLAVGGGSVVDAAKVVAMAATNGNSPEKLVGIMKGKQKPLPFYAIPTTSGTGSEVTIASVVSEKESHRKRFVIDPNLVPKAAALDPVLLATMPPAITAMTGMDALTHAVEAYLSRNASRKTDRYALEAIKRIFESLPVAFEDGKNFQAREAMALASHQAGIAFTNASLGYVHAISHQLGGIYGVSHGLGNAILLPKVLKASLPNITNQLAELAKELNIGMSDMTNEERAAAFIDSIEKLNARLNIPSVVHELQKEDISRIAGTAYEEAISSYAVPKFMSTKDIEAILCQCLDNLLNSNKTYAKVLY
ncbi:MAG: iron-containing alcohol dehydrogenase [Okeania sp. SIO3B5]|uniref:iron-containing alcohol dehydrogenase n=1 Tax=Okeania sp. SIO3B5 TaxID=2607811 RepID=UPI0014003838|nr:iron-containing alcohol dehydrogenase [Okeania sp. SIO3B5]NEO52659.1 iron-containing alcohol dehydrogenase [Okeania sp. SIO3B5]